MNDQGPPEEGPRRVPAPPVVTAALIGLLGLAVLGVGWHASTGAPASDDFVGSLPWVSWVVVAGSAAATFLVLGGFAVHILRSPEAWGLRESLVSRRRYVSPWVALVWLAHRECLILAPRLRRAPRRRSAAGTWRRGRIGPRLPGRDPPAGRAVATALRGRRGLRDRGVVGALIPSLTGAA